MLKRTALAFALGAAACTPAEGPPEAPSAEGLQETKQAVEPLGTPSEENSIRFLEQATFGPRLAHGANPLPIDTVEHVMAVGITQAINGQVSAPRSLFDGGTTSKDLGSQFFVYAVTGQDQLRQRVAFALSQIFVVSQLGIADSSTTPESEPKVALAGYLNLLSAHAFGNFRDLLEAVTLDPAMGNYLDMANNRAFDTAGRPIAPNENYAREMLQLFTLGVHKLTEGGEVVVDANNAPIPAYTEEQVQAFSRALSGWTYAKSTGCPTVGRTNSGNYTAPMIGCDVNHDSTSRTLLRGFNTSAGGTAVKHLDEALDNVFADPNLPPFICKQLIQHLVTSNPTPAYVQRVVNVFKNNGSGVRGDLRAVVKKILEDDEARGPRAPLAQHATYGHLRSPALFITSVVRWLNPTLDTATKDPGAKLNAWSRSMAQYVPRPPSVFSYYPPNAPAPGANGLLGPEFAILDTATVTARANFVYELLFYSSTATTSGIVLNLSALPTAPEDLVVWLGRYLLHDTMSSDLQVAVYNAITNPAANTTSRKQKLALYLTSLSPEFQIQR